MLYTKRKNDKTEVDFRLSFFILVCTYTKNDETNVVFCFSFFCFSLQVKKLIWGGFSYVHKLGYLAILSNLNDVFYVELGCALIEL